MHDSILNGWRHQPNWSSYPTCFLGLILSQHYLPFSVTQAQVPDSWRCCRTLQSYSNKLTQSLITLSHSLLPVETSVSCMLSSHSFCFLTHRHSPVHLCATFEFPFGSKCHHLSLNGGNFWSLGFLKWHLCLGASLGQIAPSISNLAVFKDVSSINTFTVWCRYANSQSWLLLLDNDIQSLC